MGWLWVIFVLFSVLASIFEKMGKILGDPEAPAPDRKRSAGTDPDQDQPPAPFPGRPRKVFPQNKPEPTAFPVEKHTPVELRDQPKQQEDLLTAEERDILLRLPMETESEAPFLTDFCEEDLLRQEDRLAEHVAPPEGWEGEGPSFRSAFVLAQVLARPDFSTVPWRRRI